MAYYKKIDGLRFVAISMVLIEHFAYGIAKNLSFGYYGVDLFFVISGFLITSILIKPNDLSFKSNYIKFIGRRTIRIFPIYYLTIFLLLLCNLSYVKENLFWLLTYTYNYASIFKDLNANPISHFWSLCVEEQFYLFWPIIVLMTKSKVKLLLCIIICFIVFGYGQMIFNFIPPISRYNYVGLPTRMASLSIGALGAVLVYIYGIPKNLLKSKVVEVLMFVLLLCFLILDTKYKVVVLGLCSLYLVLKAAYSEFSIKWINQLLSNDKLVGIGIVSYGIYIFHKPLAYYFTLFIFDPIWSSIDFESFGAFEILKWHSWIIKLPLFFILTILMAKLSFRYFESPLLKLKDKFFNYS